MQTTLALREKAAQLLAADTTTLAAVAAPELILFQNNFTPSEQMVIGDLTPATFDGYAPLAVTAGTQPEGLDPNTNDAIIDLAEPAGGFRWETTGVTNLPQTIDGFALTDGPGAVLYAAEKFPVPITLNAINQAIVVGRASIRQLANSMV